MGRHASDRCLRCRYDLLLTLIRFGSWREAALCLVDWGRCASSRWSKAPRLELAGSLIRSSPGSYSLRLYRSRSRHCPTYSPKLRRFFTGSRLFASFCLLWNMCCGLLSPTVRSRSSSVCTALSISLRFYPFISISALICGRSERYVYCGFFVF